MAYKIARYGWVRDLPDQRDHLYAAPPATLVALPAKMDLRTQFPIPAYDQGQIGSCTANAIGGAHEFVQINKKPAAPSPFTPSRLFIYYNERALEGTVGSDSGAQIRDGIKSIAHQGVCREDPTWPYDGDPFPPNNKLTVKPSQAAFTEAAKYKAVQYQRVPRVLAQMKGCLAAGYPFVFGFTVYESFESPQVSKTGIVPMPQPAPARRTCREVNEVASLDRGWSVAIGWVRDRRGSRGRRSSLRYRPSSRPNGRF